MHGVDGLRYREEEWRNLTGRQVPGMDCVTAHRDYLPAVRRESCVLDGTAVLQDPNGIPSVHVPDSRTEVAAGRDDVLPVRAEIRGEDCAAVPEDPGPYRAISANVPQSGRSVLARGDQALAVGTEDDVFDGRIVRRDRDSPGRMGRWQSVLLGWRLGVDANAVEQVGKRTILAFAASDGQSFSVGAGIGQKLALRAGGGLGGMRWFVDFPGWVRSHSAHNAPFSFWPATASRFSLGWNAT